jgi:Glycosyl transferase family 2
MTREEWLRRRTFTGAGFDPDDLVARKRSQGVRVSVALPARDVAETVGAIVEAVRAEWMGRRGLVDQIVVIDSGSGDATARVASDAGAEVFRAHEILPDISPEPGKGEALWKSLAVVSGDLVVWLDADVAPFDPAFVPGLLGPLLHVPGIEYVKAFYRRDLHGRQDDGGRVTEICARPLINLFYPELAGSCSHSPARRRGARRSCGACRSSPATPWRSACWWTCGAASASPPSRRSISESAGTATSRPWPSAGWGTRSPRPCSRASAGSWCDVHPSAPWAGGTPSRGKGCVPA